MSPGNRNPPFKTHEFTEHFSSGNNRNFQFFGGNQFRVIRFDRRRDDNRTRELSISGLEVGPIMTDHYANILLLQARDIIAVSDVAALNHIAQHIESFGNTAHANTADTDKMQNPDFGRNVTHALKTFSMGANWVNYYRNCPRETISFGAIPAKPHLP